MHTYRWQKAVLSLVVIRTVLLGSVVLAAGMDDPGVPAGVAAASSNATHRGRMTGGYTGFQRVLDKNLGLTPEQKEAIHGLLAEQHEQLRALRETFEPKYTAIQQDTDAKIRAQLSPEQQTKFDALVAKQKTARASRQTRP